jgi:hypothetical protein
VNKPIQFKFTRRFSNTVNRCLVGQEFHKPFFLNNQEAHNAKKLKGTFSGKTNAMPTDLGVYTSGSTPELFQS